VAGSRGRRPQPDIRLATHGDPRPERRAGLRRPRRYRFH
jgi:hypothetical protein